MFVSSKLNSSIYRPILPAYNTMSSPPVSIDVTKAQSVDKEKLRKHTTFQSFGELALFLEQHSDFAWSAEEARHWISQPEQDWLKDIESTWTVFEMALHTSITKDSTQKTGAPSTEWSTSRGNYEIVSGVDTLEVRKSRKRPRLDTLRAEVRKRPSSHNQPTSSNTYYHSLRQSLDCAP